MSPPARLVPARLVSLRRLLAAALAALLAGAFALIAPSPAAAVAQGWVRLAHFSPDTPPVDVYLASFEDPAKPAVFNAVGYGVLSEYQRLAEGRYTVSMRAAGADPASPPVISKDVRVTGDKAYTVAGMGRNASLVIDVITDDLNTPPSGQSRVRVIQASSRAPLVTVSAKDGPVIAKDASFPSTSPYVALAPKGWTVDVAGAGGKSVATAPLDAFAGGIYSLVVLDSKQASGVEVMVRNDAASASKAPSGGVDTGLGGTGVIDDGATGTGLLQTVALVVLLLLMGGVGAVAVRVQSRQ